MLDRDNPVLVPVRWTRFILVAMYFLFLISMSIDPTRSDSTDYVLLCFQTLVGLRAVSLGVCYTISKENLVIKFLGIPIRYICWDEVRKASYLHSWRDPKTRFEWHKYGPVNGQIIYVTLKGCPEYHPLRELRWWHNLRHPFRAITIWLPGNNVLYYVESFQKYYPQLEIQE